MTSPGATPTVRGPREEELLWDAVDRLLASADVAGVVAHGLGPLEARRLRRLGEPVPAALVDEERLARVATMTAIPALGRIREVVEGPLVLFKGPEVAFRYPDRARSFVDIDLLAPQGRLVHEALKASGFVEVDDPELFRDHHHLRPLQAPGLWLKVEVHERPMLPPDVEPRLADIFEQAVPSILGIDGLSAPHPVHHALLLAAHAWLHEPFHRLRDLVDVAAVSQEASEAELALGARAWGLERIWRTTWSATTSLLGEGSTPLALRLFGRHLPHVRERTVLDNHLQRWLHFFWELPLWSAVRRTGVALRQEVLPAPGESWGEKLTRVRSGLLHPRRSMSAHTASWRSNVAANRARQRR
jgi:hypothetical protein